MNQTIPVTSGKAHGNHPSMLNLLTFARFLAAMGVVVFHWGHVALMKTNGELAYMASIGYIYVGFFYVLSGFVLTYSLNGKKTRVREFMVARVARVYPAFALALVLMIPHFVLRIHEGEYSTTRLIASLISVPTLMQAWLPLTAQAWNFTSWSVSAELFFYIAFPYALTRIRSIGSGTAKTTSKHIRFISILWIISLIPSILYILLNPDKGLSHKDAELGWLSVLYFSPLLRLPEFLAGISLALIVAEQQTNRSAAPKKARLMNPIGIFVAGIAGILIVLAFRPAWTADSILHNGLLLPLWAAVIYGLALIEMNATILVPSFLILLGEASYGIYILQVPISNAFKFFIKLATGHTIRGDFDTISLLCVYSLVLVIFSILSFKYFETPARLLIRRTLNRKNSKAPIAKHKISLPETANLDEIPT